MSRQFIGSILLIIGTSVGAGMLVLPIISATEGFITATGLMFVCWLLMTFGAFLILEVITWLPLNSNMISMSKATLGNIGQIITWLTYLLLLYSLICAYTASISDIFYTLLSSINLNINQWVASTLVILIFSIITWYGIKTVDTINRLLMLIAAIAYLLFISVIMPHVSPSKLIEGHLQLNITTITVMITSFGFAIIIPSLRVYLKNDIQKLRLAIFTGSLIPFILYVLWIAVVHGTLNKIGPNSLIQIAASDKVTSKLATILSQQIHNTYFTTFVYLFMYLCVATSFLGVAVSLFDFLADGLKLNKKGTQGAIVFLCTFAPPLIIVLFAPGVFIKALNYAGIFCIILLLLLPILMAWNGRYCKKITTDLNYRVLGGKFLLIIGGLVSITLISWNILEQVI